MYRFLKHTADVLFEVEATSLNKLFEDAGKAVMATMAELKTVKPRIKKTVNLTSDKVEDLLYNFLSELVYLKDSEYLLFSEFKVNIETIEVKKINGEYNHEYDLMSELKGEKIDAKKHKLGVDVKAITMHMFTVEKRGKKWFAKVLLDV